MEKVFVVSKDEIDEKINPLLKKGWTVKHLISENVSVSICGQYSNSDKMTGDIIFVLDNGKTYFEDEKEN